MLTIRLQRMGKAKYPTYRFIVSEKGRTTRGRYLELLGHCDPHDKENKITINTERLNYWISKGAQMSSTVNNLLIKNGLIKGDKQKSVFLSKNRKKKIEEKKKANAPKPAPEPVAPKIEPVAPVAPVAQVAPVEPKVAQEVSAPESVPAPAEAPAPEVVPEVSQVATTEPVAPSA